MHFAKIDNVKHDLDNPDYYINREFSALAFNHHVLQQARDPSIPLLERLRFLFIVSSNLDEFFEIRVAGIKETIAIDPNQLSIDGLTQNQVLEAISEKAHKMNEELYTIFNQSLLPSLSKHKINFLHEKKWNKKIRLWVDKLFLHEILPILSPVGLDLAHPFPRLINKSLNFIISLTGKDAFGRNLKYAFVNAPRSLPRALRLPKELISDGHQFIHLSSIIKMHIHRLFPGMEISGCYAFRLTRNSDLFLREEEVEDLASAMRSGLLTRHYGHAVRLEIEKKCPAELVEFLMQKHHLQFRDTYSCDGPVNLRSYMDIIEMIERPDLKYRETTGENIELHHQSIFETIKQKDILLHHPYQSFNIVIDFVKQAATDPNVLAIKQTLYRTHTGSAMVKALIEAARSGKEVTAVIELRARFDEESNLKLANELQQAGVLVVYGVVNFKAHAKMTLVVRRETRGLIRYVHLGTGNYHERTAKLYTDIGLLTCDKAITRDTQIIFHQLTGLGKTVKLKSLYYAPFTLHRHVLGLISDCIAAKKKGREARIIIKVNGLTDKSIIKALYAASQAGIKIHLVIRTLCCLRPGIKGISENITVTSHMDRFLEHHRIYYFKIAKEEFIYGASADLMERNLYKRIEVMFPITDETAKNRIKSEIIQNYTNKNRRCWQAYANGEYRYKHADKASAQEVLLEAFKLK